jgi:hypothetical protein
VKSVKDIYRLIINFDVHKHAKIQSCDPDMRELFHILLDTNRSRRIKKVVPKEVTQLALFNSEGINFDTDHDDTVNKVMTVVTKIKQIKKEDIEVQKEKFERNRHKKNVSEFK